MDEFDEVGIELWLWLSLWRRSLVCGSSEVLLERLFEETGAVNLEPFSKSRLLRGEWNVLSITELEREEFEAGEIRFGEFSLNGELICSTECEPPEFKSKLFESDSEMSV